MKIWNPLLCNRNQSAGVTDCASVGIYRDSNSHRGFVVEVLVEKLLKRVGMRPRSCGSKHSHMTGVKARHESKTLSS